MQTLEMSLSELVTSGVVSYEEALNRSLYPEGSGQAVGGPRCRSTPHWA